MFDQCLSLIKRLYPDKEQILLHEPVFLGNEKKYLNECIDSTYVSYVGQFVNKFEAAVMDYTGSKNAKAMINGTAALHMALMVAGVEDEDLVISQSLTFVATANAISYCRAEPVFIDVDPVTMGMDPEMLRTFLREETRIEAGILKHKKSNKRIKACVPVHVMGHSCAIQEIAELCADFGVTLIEDAAEGIGSFNGSDHLGTVGSIGILSFNGNKTITTGCGGMLLSKDKEIADRIEHLSTTAKKKHLWAFEHDAIGYNYRLSNLSAAIGLAQMEKLETILVSKRETAHLYRDFFKDKEAHFMLEPEGTHSNYWLNTIMLANQKEQEEFLIFMNRGGVNCRPLWKGMHQLPMFSDAICTDLSVTEKLTQTLVNLPSGYR